MIIINVLFFTVKINLKLTPIIQEKLIHFLAYLKMCILMCLTCVQFTSSTIFLIKPICGSGHSFNKRKNIDERKGRAGKRKFDVETLELEIIWVNGTHATVNLAR